MIVRNKRYDYRLAAVIGAVVATLAYFNFFSVQNSYLTREGCLQAGGTIEQTRCNVNGLSLEVRG